MTIKIVTSLAYLAICFYLGYRGWKETREASDYMLAGRRMNAFIMSMSYAATFISTSAIIGFGGVASLFGLPLLWLTFANIALGMFAAMVFFGRRTRRMGLVLDSHTFPEFLGRRYQSRFIQGFAGAIIFLFMPLYGSAVLIGISRLLEISLGIPYVAVLVGFTLIVAAYVLTGGLKAVMYTDAFQGLIMLAMMLIWIGYTYWLLGGVTEAHKALADMAPLVPEKLKAGGLLGWTQGASFGSPIWLTIYTTIIYGVGIGVLAQPQLAVRYMTVPNDKALDRAVGYGGPFILVMTAVPYLVGALSNVVFQQRFGKLAIAMAGGNVDKVIPTFIETIMPPWFSVLFLLAMFAAAMSTLSSQYHTTGTAMGRDLLEKCCGIGREGSTRGTRAGVLVAIVMALGWALVLPESVIARATAFFFGLCAATFLPVYFLGLYWKRMTRAGAVASMTAGFACSMFWLLFIFEKIASEIGLCRALTGKATLMADAAQGSLPWLLQWLDPNLFALPFSALVAVGVSLATRPMDEEHLDRCWSNF